MQQEDLGQKSHNLYIYIHMCKQKKKMEQKEKARYQHMKHSTQENLHIGYIKMDNNSTTNKCEYEKTMDYL